MTKTKLIKSDPGKLSILVDRDNIGQVYCGLQGASSYEQSIFLDSLEEILDQIDNPRYILVRHSPLVFMNRNDFHSVPSRIAIRKEWAEIFAKNWTNRVGSNELVYTRTPRGRKFLLHARSNAMSSLFNNRSQRI